MGVKGIPTHDFKPFLLYGTGERAHGEEHMLLLHRTGVHFQAPTSKFPTVWRFTPKEVLSPLLAF